MNITQRAMTYSESWCHHYYEEERVREGELQGSEPGYLGSGCRQPFTLGLWTAPEPTSALLVLRTLPAQWWFSAWAAHWNYLGSLVLR